MIVSWLVPNAFELPRWLVFFIPQFSRAFLDEVQFQALPRLEVLLCAASVLCVMKRSCSEDDVPATEGD